ncbi:protein Gawky-like isoform X2 [Pollicipes pollicipes]|uniref:protein Gawky-like isoform X2 n=1 Tax=Pollicipes pollicipes TaxID=41117 RepID=UPI0018858BF3|nr:protein Gawky-like isoform X2 [Pollicipes pollicipes]
MDAQWSHHIPQSNLGGTWGEDDDSAQANSMWTGAPSGPPGPPGPPGNHWGGGGGPAGPGGMWPGGPGKKDDWGGHKPWEARGPNGDGWGNKPPGPWTGGPPQHGPGTWGGDHSPPMPRRPIGFDDWGERSRPGNKRGGGGGGGGWKELPGGPGRAGLPGGPPAPHMLSRMPPGPPDHKGVDPWGRPPRNGWGEAPPGPVSGWGGDDGPAGWAAKPKTPTMPGGWAEPDMDWAKAGRAPGMHTGSKGAMYDKFRTLTDQGFKPEEVDMMLRGGGGMALEDAVDQLRLAGPAGDWRGVPDHPPFEQPGFAQMPPPHVQYGGMQMPNTGHGGGNMNSTVVQQLLRQQAQSQPSRFPGQPQPSPQQLRPVINQIQMAVHAGHLNPAILQQPMGQQTLILLNHLLSQIKQLEQLTRQQQLLGRGPQANSPHFQSLQMEIMRTKGNISNIQSQIGSQQAMLLKQQQMSSGGGGGPMMFKQGPGGPSDLHGLPGLTDMSLRDGGGPGPGGHAPQSRLSQWKLPTSDKLYRPDEDFSRAPGSSSKVAGSPPLPLMGDSTWSAARAGGEAGWPDGAGAAAPPAAERVDSKDPGWPSAAGGHNSYADLVPEFEPGKPWKGSQMKSVEDDPGLTPGSVRSSLGLAGAAATQDLLASMQPGKASPLGGGAGTDFGSSTWSYNPAGGKPGGMGGASKWDTGADWSMKSRGPPPGLNKGAGWGRGGAPYDQRSAFAPVQGGGGGWGAPGGGSAWLLLRNLTAQIDGSTLKTLCMQHGPLYTFHMYLSQGVALVKYSSREEAAKAQGALNNCVLSNTTIMAEAVTDEYASQVLQQLGLPGGQPAPSSSAGPGAGQAAAKPPASAAWSDIGDPIGGASMAWSSGAGAGGGGALWGTGGLEEAGRPYLPEGLL